MPREPMTTDELIAAVREVSGLVVLVALAALAWIACGCPDIHSMG
jgi:hypothetical protein